MFIHTLTLGEILSFRWVTTIELKQLNVLIGPNGAGKSNFIECIALLQALPNKLNSFLIKSGGPDSWIRKKSKNSTSAFISCVFHADQYTLQYQLGFSAMSNSLAIELEDLDLLENGKKTSYFFRHANELLISPKPAEPMAEVSNFIDSNQSIFEAYRNPFENTPIIQTARAFDLIRIYREFKTSVNDGTRKGIASDMLKHPLDDGGANLALVLQEMDFHGSLQKVKGYLRRLSGRFEDLKIRLIAGFAQVYIIETDIGAVPATRLSDGTLKFLCLMAILCDHDPPPLVCIEEPEVGLHPDALRLVAEALKEASSRMQIIVTTHSDALIDYFSDEPEAILVCERDADESTQFKRLQRDQLQEWLEDYTLGDLWRRGGVGGTLR